MECYHIRGGNKIEGEYTVKGAKNAALPILASAIAVGGHVEISGCPEIADVENMLEILRALGCRAEKSGGAINVDASQIDCHTVPQELMREMRSSVFLMGPLLARCGEVVLGKPGGCEIGKRPVDIHISALTKLGAVIKETDGLLICRGENLTGANITLEFPSVGATENVMLAALAADGETIIKNAAREPEIADLQNFLTGCGARIKGAGSDEIVVSGRRNPSKFFRGSSHRVIPDRIEAGTLLAAAAGTGGTLFLKGAETPHMAATLEKFKEAGCYVRRYDDGVLIKRRGKLSPVSIVTMPYPGFPTDMQSQFLALMTMADGVSDICETIFEDRYKQVPELQKMGAIVRISDRHAQVSGVSELKGCRVNATDLRGGAALVIAGLMASGETVIENAFHIERGYDKLDKVLNALGADMRRIAQ